MASLKKCQDLMERYAVARIPFIALQTVERGRALEMLKSIAGKLLLPFYVHTLSKGVYDLSTGKVLNEDKSVYGALDYISEQMTHRQNLSFILTEPPDLSADTADARQLLDLVTLANETGGEIIIFSTSSG